MKNYLLNAMGTNVNDEIVTKEILNELNSFEKNFQEGINKSTENTINELKKAHKYKQYLPLEQNESFNFKNYFQSCFKSFVKIYF